MPKSPTHGSGSGGAGATSRITLVAEPPSSPPQPPAIPTATAIAVAPTTRLSRSCVRWRWTTLRLVLLAIYLLSGTSNSLLWGAYLARDDPKSTLPGGNTLKYLALAASVSEVLRVVYMLVVSRQ